MMQEKTPKTPVNTDERACNREAGCLYALLTGLRPVSRRNRASWYLNQLNKVVKCNHDLSLEEDESVIIDRSSDNAGHAEDSMPTEQETHDIRLVSVTINPSTTQTTNTLPDIIEDNSDDQTCYVSPNTRVLFLSKSIATSIILDLSPSVVSVSPQNDCVFLDSLFDAVKRVLHLLVKSHEIPSSSTNVKPQLLQPKVYVSVIAYTPFVIAKDNQVLVQSRRITSANIDQVLVEIWICLNRLTLEIHELVSSTCSMNFEFDNSKNVFVFPHSLNGNIIRHPGSVLEDIYELGSFSSSLMPKLSRLSITVISDGLFASSNNLSIFRLKSIAVSFVSLGTETTYPDACFGYTPYIDLMKFTAKTTLGLYLSHRDLINSSQTLSKLKQVPFLQNPLNRLFCWTLHSEINDDTFCYAPRVTNCLKTNTNSIDPEHIVKFFCIDQPIDSLPPSVGHEMLQANQSDTIHNYHDWRSFRQLERNLDADFEQVLAYLLREGYLIKNIHFKHKENSKIVARLVLHWKHNLDLEQELTATYWSQTDPFDMGENNQLILRPFKAPLYGDTYCEIIVHGSYSFLHNLYCDRRIKRKSEYREVAYKQFRQLIDGVRQTHERLQYLSRFYRDSSLSKVPSFLLHGNSLLYEQPHTHRLTSTIDNVLDETKTSLFQEYWQKISCLETRSWKNLMHIHTLRLVLEHDQPKHKNIHCQNANGRYTHVQCRRALSAISSFIKSYASFALLEDTTYIKFIYNKDDDLREIETSATKGFIVIRINKLLPIIVIYLMFTSGILDSHRIQIVSYLEKQLVDCKIRNTRTSTVQMDNILRAKTISPSSESCCVLIKSPLERMLKVYSRSFIGDFLIHNWAHGLPGSCPYGSITQQQSLKFAQTATVNPDNQNNPKQRSDSNKERFEGNSSESAINRYNLVFGKYLYGVRVVQTIKNLPHDVVPSLASNVFSKISAVLVNVRIKQGFHIAFNNSGILNLVVELAMKDPASDPDRASSCLCQYIVFPPTITNCQSSINTILGPHATGASSKSGSLSGSLANSESYMKNAPPESTPHLRVDNGEIKIIKEYWIEQQYGISARSTSYHNSLQDMRYSEVVDHLFISDLNMFDCLLTYELLQLLCDRASAYYDLDSALAKSETKDTPMLSPTTSTTSSSIFENNHSSPNPVKPSALIEGNLKDGLAKVPLLELDYRFSVMKFLSKCQQASLDILLFKDSSDFYKTSPEDYLKVDSNEGLVTADSGFCASTSQLSSVLRNQQSRKMSADMNAPDVDHGKREHRSSYQHDNLMPTSYTYMNPIYSPSLNHLFLETLHKRLKQIHDKELKLSDYDRRNLPAYLKQRKILAEQVGSDTEDTLFNCMPTEKIGSLSSDELHDSGDLSSKEENSCSESEDPIEWRCFLRKGNQENFMLVLVPATLGDVTKWLKYVNNDINNVDDCDPICPIFVFRCSSTMINDHILAFLKTDSDLSLNRNCLEADLSLHFGQPCKYMGQVKTYNDELNIEILPLIRYGALNQTTSDEKTLEIVHFRAFLRKIKNTVLKSRFSSLNDAYLSELFIHKDDILYYINNVDMDTQKKYHVSSQLKGLAEFIKNYEEYNDSLPKEPGKPCNKLLNSILLQKCGLFINQPIARFDETNPLIKQLHDKKLLFLMRCNYKIDLPILEESLAGSTLLKGFIKTPSNATSQPGAPSLMMTTNSIGESTHLLNNVSTSSLGKTEGSRLMDMKCGSVGASGSPSASFVERLRIQQAPRFGSNSTLSSLPNSANDSFILEAFKGSKACSIQEISADVLKENSDITLRHEAHMAEVLKRTSERKESHQYRRVLKSKGNYNQSHSAIDQALKRVDSLGRLEHFCLTPLLFSPSWRSKLAPVRDHTIESNKVYRDDDNQNEMNKLDDNTETSDKNRESISETHLQTSQQEAEDRWHQMVCNNYIKEYEQYIQTLGFNSVQIKHQTGNKGSITSGANLGQAPLKDGVRRSSKSSVQQQAVSTTNPLASSYSSPNSSGQTPTNNFPINLRRGSISTSAASLLGASNATSSNTGYLIKFLNSGCLVFKVGFCKPYVYYLLYSIEGERFNNSNMKLNMTTFLDELDNIKVTMHLHSFTYDYHLRSMYSYISGRQLTFSPGYHLISFLDDFRKYYQKAPNYARNHILSGEVSITNIKVSGQQLYNYIVTHNTTYNMEVLEMSSSIASVISNLTSRTFTDDQRHDNTTTTASLKELMNQDTTNSSSTTVRSHANDYVLIELKREKVRYRDGKDPDIFDCGLLITHDNQNSGTNKNCLTLKYFLLLTNQRDLYPKLIHSYDKIITLGCHRPIRLGITQQLKARQQQQQESYKVHSGVSNQSSGDHSDQDDVQSSEIQSSGEMSGPTSFISTANSAHSSSSGLQFGCNSSVNRSEKVQQEDRLSTSSQQPTQRPSIKVDESEEVTGKNSLEGSLNLDNCRTTPTPTTPPPPPPPNDLLKLSTTSSVEENSSQGDASPAAKRRSKNSSESSVKKNLNGGNIHERAICDEEITYLGYFSSDELDMLKFLQEKTANLRSHIEEVVRLAEVHYRRDYIWHKLMQRTTGSSNKADDIPLTIEELIQLLEIVEPVDLAALDPQLTNFTTMQNINWYLKLLKAFNDLKQSPANQHRIYTVKASKLLLLYIDPKCTTAFILLSIDIEKSSVELTVLLKDKQECGKMSKKTPIKSVTSSIIEQSTTTFELDLDCQQLINDFINFCATFMWSTFLT